MNQYDTINWLSEEQRDQVRATTEKRLRQQALALMPHLPEDEREAFTVLRRARDLVRWRSRTTDEDKSP